MYLRYDELITESPEDLARLERRHRASPVADRFRMLRLLKTGAARSRRSLASTLGYSERQLHRWFDTYRDEGLEALAHYETSSGSDERITDEALTALEAEMEAGKIATLKQAQAFLEQRFAISYSVGGLSALFQRKKIKLKTGRRRHVKADADQQAAFKKQFRAEIEQRQAELTPGKRLRVLALDEARFGLQTHYRRRWCPREIRPPWPHQHRYEWLWLYAAVEPAIGESFCLYMPHLDGDCMTVFLAQLRAAFGEDEIVLVLDCAGAHRSGVVEWPDGITPLYLPPRSPELDPAERWFRELRGALSKVAHATLSVLESALTDALRPYWEDTRKLARLVGYPWWIEATGSILTPAQ